MPPYEQYLSIAHLIPEGKEEDYHYPLEIDTALALKAVDLASMRRGHFWAGD